MRQRHIHFYPAHAVVDAAIDEFFGSVFSNPKGSKYPLTDVYTINGIAYLEIAIAGFTKEEIKIELTEDSLRIIGCKQEETNAEAREYIKRDIAKRNFDVAYSLMFPVDHIDAEIVDGILKVVVVPLNKQKEVKQIEIK